MKAPVDMISKKITCRKREYGGRKQKKRDRGAKQR